MSKLNISQLLSLIRGAEATNDQSTASTTALDQTELASLRLRLSTAESIIDALRIENETATRRGDTEHARAEKAIADLAAAKVAHATEIADVRASVDSLASTKALQITQAQGQPPVVDAPAAKPLGGADHIAIHAELQKTDPRAASVYYRANKAAYDAQVRERQNK